MMRIPYSSCGFVTSVITFDKAACKRALHGAGLNMAREILLDRHSQVDPDEVIGRLGLPLFVKPNASGSSFGVTKVKTREQLLPAVEAAFAESDHVLMEECIDGREISCGVMIAGGKEYLCAILRCGQSIADACKHVLAGYKFVKLAFPSGIIVSP